MPDLLPQMIGADRLGLLQEELFRRTPADATASGLFILGSPRTGSTLLYQMVAASFGLPFIDNLTNDIFPKTPILGLTFGRIVAGSDAIGFSSRYGKVDGLTQPSEGSAVMKNWFGGGHPSQLVSRTILPGREDHLRKTLASCSHLLGGPLLSKNAWNCFRAEYLANALPEACFIWIRRDIRAAARSDLQARYVVQRDPNIWNSATPAKLEALQRRPYWEQVVENQFEFGEAIQQALGGLPRRRWIQVWMEDLVCDAAATISGLTELDALRGRKPRPDTIRQAIGIRAEASELPPADAEAIESYVAANLDRLGPYVRETTKRGSK